MLIIISGAISLWFVGDALRGAFLYSQLEAQAPALLTQIQVRKEGGAKYLMEADYLYRVQGVEYSGKTLFCEPVYLNQISAEQDLGKWRALEWQAWYVPSHPEKSSLQRFFPLKTCVYALLTLGVFTYFFLLRYFAFSRSRWKNDL